MKNISLPSFRPDTSWFVIEDQIIILLAKHVKIGEATYLAKELLFRIRQEYWSIRWVITTTKVCRVFIELPLLFDEQVENHDRCNQLFSFFYDYAVLLEEVFAIFLFLFFVFRFALAV